MCFIKLNKKHNLKSQDIDVKDFIIFDIPHGSNVITDHFEFEDNQVSRIKVGKYDFNNHKNE